MDEYTNFIINKESLKKETKELIYIYCNIINLEGDNVCAMIGPFEDTYKNYRKKYLKSSDYGYFIRYGNPNLPSIWMFEKKYLDIIRDTLNREELQYQVKELNISQPETDFKYKDKIIKYINSIEKNIADIKNLFPHTKICSYCKLKGNWKINDCVDKNILFCSLFCKYKYIENGEILF